MAKPVPLDAGALSSHTPSPKASTTARRPAPAVTEKVDNVPFQVRIPKADAKAVRVIAAQREQSISDFVLMCVRDWRERNGA